MAGSLVTEISLQPCEWGGFQWVVGTVDINYMLIQRRAHWVGSALKAKRYINTIKRGPGSCVNLLLP